ncbi:MAG: steroid 5-alpha reductase family enzyme [Mariniblastus sp.]|jgi:steroid 5-alpha reductase family enzyme
MNCFTLLDLGIIYFCYMSLLWWMGWKVPNAGLVDFGWPSGFTAIALFYLFTGDGLWQRKAILVS